MIVALTPNIDLTFENSPSETYRTYKLNRDTGRITGMIDGIDALNQFVDKALQTERFKYIIYDDQYGREFNDLLIKNFTEELIKSELARTITEALIYDERILQVGNFNYITSKESIEVTFNIESIYGTTQFNKIINYNKL